MNGGEHTGTDLKRLLQLGRQRMTPGLSGPPWLSAVRERGAAAVASMPTPDRRQEAWRYTPVGFLEQAVYQPLVEGPFDAVQPADVEELMLHGSDAVRLVFVNGYLAVGLTPAVRCCAGVTVSNLTGELGVVPEGVRRQLDAVAEYRHVFAALNSALMSDGALIHIGSGVSSNRPIEILHISVGMDEPGIAHPRHMVVLEDGARAEVVERYAAMGDGGYFNNALIEVVIGKDSELVHQRVQEESRNAQHLSDLHVRLAERGRYRLAQASLGGAWSRTEVRVAFEGEGGSAEIDGLMLARDQQLTDVHLDIQHKVPHCTSRETFKGILDGKGRVVFDGHIVVARDAQKTDAVLANDNLMLSRSAEVDTKPQLEIYADDVKCSHGTTVGELDADMLFYLRSRGIAEGQAKQMLCQGFAAEIIEKMDHPALRTHVGELLAARLMESV